MSVVIIQIFSLNSEHINERQLHQMQELAININLKLLRDIWICEHKFVVFSGASK